MIRTADPRFRRRLNELGQTVERANESAQSGLYIFTQKYIKPCLESVGSCVATCVDTSCPSLDLRQRDRLRRQRGRGRSRGRAEQSFDFYDDWDEDENDGLLGWGGDEFDRLLAGSGGYGTLSTNAAQPARQRGMTYPKDRRKSATQAHDGRPDPTVIPGASFFGKLFGGARPLRYKPSAADLQDHPGARRLNRDLTESQTLLQEHETGTKGRTRARSGTTESGETTDSYSSRGDIFPSDEEDDAVPLDDEFAMVLERRTTQSGGPDAEATSGKTRNSSEGRRGKRTSTGSRASTRRTLSSRSARSSTGKTSQSRRGSSAQTPVQGADASGEAEERIPVLSELKQEEARVEHEEEVEVERRRQEAQRLAAERGLVASSAAENPSSKEDSPQATTPASAPVQQTDQPSQLPTPLATDDEDDTEPIPPGREGDAS